MKVTKIEENLKYFCYETIMFGQVTHKLDAPAMRVRSLFASFTFCNISGSCSLIPKENIGCYITCVSLMEILATINLYYFVVCFILMSTKSHK